MSQRAFDANQFRTGLKVVRADLPKARAATWRRLKRHLGVALDALKQATLCLGYLVIHLVILATYPLSLPILAKLAVTVRKRALVRAEMLRSQGYVIKDVEAEKWRDAECSPSRNKV